MDFLLFNNASSIGYADIVKGDLRMLVVVPTVPTAGDSRKFGFYSVNRQSGIYFEVAGAVFQAVAVDGVSGTSQTKALTFDPTWDSLPIWYRIKWEAGFAEFYINGVFVARLAFSDANVVLASTPLSIYINNAVADDMFVGYIEAVGIQSYFDTTVPTV